MIRHDDDNGGDDGCENIGGTSCDDDYDTTPDDDDDNGCENIGGTSCDDDYDTTPDDDG